MGRTKKMKGSQSLKQRLLLWSFDTFFNTYFIDEISADDMIPALRPHEHLRVVLLLS
ncbi:unnamed protein product [Arabidopsis halleri]